MQRLHSTKSATYVRCFLGRRWLAGLATAVCAGAILAGCQSKGGHAGPPGPPAATMRGSARSMTSASELAGRVPSCERAPVRAVDRAAPAFVHDPAVFATAASVAVCRLRGRSIVIFAVTSSQRPVNEAHLRSDVTFFAIGAGWSAAAEEVDDPDGEKSVAQDVALALAGQIVSGRAR